MWNKIFNFHNENIIFLNQYKVMKALNFQLVLAINVLIF